MPTDIIAFACKHCGKKYKVKADMAGKKAKCQGCGQAILVPTPKAAPAQQAAATSAPAPQARPVSAPAQDEFGLGEMHHEDDPFMGVEAAPTNPQHNPLANHVVTNPGFAEAVTDVDQLFTADEHEYGRNPVIAQMEARHQQQQEKFAQAEKTSEKKTKSSNPLASPAVVVGVLLFVCLMLAAIVGFLASARSGVMVSAGVMGAAYLGMFGAWIWAIFLILTGDDENKVVQLILFLFVPFYNLIYSFQRFERMKGFLGLFFTCLLVGMIAGGLMGFFMAQDA